MIGCRGFWSSPESFLRNFDHWELFTETPRIGLQSDENITDIAHICSSYTTKRYQDWHPGTDSWTADGQLMTFLFGRFFQVEQILE